AVEKFCLAISACDIGPLCTQTCLVVQQNHEKDAKPARSWESTVCPVELKCLARLPTRVSEEGNPTAPGSGSQRGTTNSLLV
ncbi:MAG: hypothetical protein AAF483_29205, partial [Planctomycetota bacterium]